ncbi:HNH endonuclease signature motif containing protein [Chelatococcus sp. HY11]|uniref:HNH endonuclease signature motif containing protein n=2 Tax=Hyphomicrobiales TaxID=356 RepID=UPI001BCCDE85|nr:HNH endonuclease [Chelatococcus sp. HY11]MBX3491210.1 HNH endonuclease [Parvibaculum sp.]MBX3544502.1 HNH endonuclease [Chelatococcus sp.]
MKRTPKICSCGRLLAPGAVCQCRAARKRDADARRPNARQRGYDGEWQAVRALFLAAHPMCCQPGCTARATEVDHVISVRQRPDLRLSWSNLRPFCKPHHSARTAREQAFGRGTR